MYECIKRYDNWHAYLICFWIGLNRVLIDVLKICDVEFSVELDKIV